LANPKITKPFLSLGLILLFIIAPFTAGFTLDKFADGSTSKDHTFPPGGGTTPTSTYQLEIERGAVLEQATFSIIGKPDGNGNYPKNVTIDVGSDGDKEWRFKGTGKGHLGLQNEFSDGARSKTATFSNNGFEANQSIRLPIGATVTTTEMDIQGSGGQGDNLAPLATGANSGGGTGTYGPINLNDGQLELTENAQCWVSAGSSPGTAWFSYTWTIPQAIFGIWVDTFGGSRCLAGGTIQYHSGSSWINDGVVSNRVNDWYYNFTTPVTTTAIRIYGAHATTFYGGQTSNPLIYEWEVYEISGAGPENATMDIGCNGGTPEWSHPNLFLGEEPVPTFTNELNTILGSNPTPSMVDDWGNSFLDIPINISSDTMGRISILNLSIEYTYTATVDVNDHNVDLKTEINELISAAGPGDTNLTIPIIVESSHGGVITIDNINLYYDQRPIWRMLPDVIYVEEDANGTAILDFKEYISDDIDEMLDLTIAIKSQSNENIQLNITLDKLLMVDSITENWNSQENEAIYLEFSLSDSGGHIIDSIVTSIWVEPINDEPLANPEIALDNRVVAEGSKDTSLDIDDQTYFYDVEHDILYYEVLIDPMNTLTQEQKNITVKLDQNSLVVEIKALGDFNTEDGPLVPVYIFCDDDKDPEDGGINTTANGEGNYVHREFFVEVSPVNDEPTWTSAPQITCDEDTQPDPLDLRLHVFDIETEVDSLKFQLVRLPETTYLKAGLEGPVLNVEVVPDFFGSGRVTVEVEDEEGETAVQDFEIIVNPVNDPPALEITSPAEDAQVMGLVAIRGSANDIDNTKFDVKLRINEGEWIDLQGQTTWTYMWDTTDVENGEYTIEAKAWDGELESEIRSKVLNVVNHINEPPFISFSSPSNGTMVSGIINITGTAGDPENIRSTVNISIGDGGLWQPVSFDLSMGYWSHTVDTTLHSDGNITILAKAFDGDLHSLEANMTLVIKNEIEDTTTPIDVVDDDDDKGKKTYIYNLWWIIIIIVMVALVLLVVVIYYRKKHKDEEEKRIQEDASKAAASQVAPASLKIATPAQVQPQTGP